MASKLITRIKSQHGPTKEVPSCFRSQSKRRFCSKFRLWIRASSHCYGNKVGCNMGMKYQRVNIPSSDPQSVRNGSGWVNTPFPCLSVDNAKCIPCSSLRVSSGTEPRLPTVVAHLLKHIFFFVLLSSLSHLSSLHCVPRDSLQNKLEHTKSCPGLCF